ncbi:hypothetical protein C6P46_005742 [Rhodotorula mucilaginosa]|uniref:Purple acid phosphatase n=1 Tax=Rhodotorula mucilaginosa TaxID=5537 RepID=A0A9P6VZT8_RHOMI|nr:hypothetical protein C6P46_005742 [Rhodotorula mucilaginosa]
MLSRLLQLAAIAGLASSVFAQSCPNGKDIGNGVHVPGNIPANPYEPLQHRLAYAGPTGMTVSWNTFSLIDQPMVWYGLNPGKLDMYASSNDSRTYNTSRTWNNHVKITGLEPGTEYYYRVSGTNGANAAYLPTYKFKTARLAGDDKPLTIATFGDLGLMGRDGLSTRTGPIGGDNYTALGASETNTIRSLLQMKDTYEFLYHTGDIGYADYFLKESVQGYFGTADNETMPTVDEVAEGYESLSEQFFDQMVPITAEKPWMVLAGNHEANCDNGGVTDKKHNITYTSDYCLPAQQNFTWYNKHYNMPSAESGGVSNMWYSFESGPVHFVSLLTETDLGEGLLGPIEKAKGNVNGPFGKPNQQVDWLKADLASVDRQKTPWVVVGLHRPWYTSIQIPEVYTAWQQAFEKIMYDYNVDMYLTGHVHTQEVFTPMFNGTADPNGLNNPRAPWPIVQGAAGHYDGLDQFESSERLNGSIYSTDQAYGWGKLTFHNRTHVTYDYVASRNSSVIQSNTLYKEHSFGGAAGGASSKNKDAKDGGKKAPKVNIRQSIDF